MPRITDTYKQIAEDAIALLNEWDKNDHLARHKMGAGGPEHRVMDADLADLYRRMRGMVDAKDH